MQFVWFRSTSLRVFKFLQINEGGFNFWGEPIFQNAWIIWSPLLYFNFQSFFDPNCSPLIIFQCIFLWFRSTSHRVFKILQIKEGGFNFWGEPIFQNLWIIWSPLLYLSLKSPMDQNSSSFIRFQFILHESGRLFSDSWRFYKLKRGGPNFWGKPILQNVWIIWSPLLYFNFKSFLDPNSSPFISFQCILYDSGVLLSGFSNFYKLKRGDLISGGTNFAECLNYLVPPSVFQS